MTQNNFSFWNINENKNRKYQQYSLKYLLGEKEENFVISTPDWNFPNPYTYKCVKKNFKTQYASRTLLK